MKTKKKETGRKLRLVFLSDTHELHRETTIPPCDILVHAGDVTMSSRSAAALRDFDDWLAELPCRHRLVVPGNHDTCFERGHLPNAHLRNAKVLVDEAVRVEGLAVWGSPVTPLSIGAFGMPSLEARRRLYRSIPLHTDVVITHGPPLGILDQSPGSTDHQGCPALLEAVNRTAPVIHCFGHVHGAYGVLFHNTTMFVNAALLGMDGDLARPPVVIDLPKRSHR